MTLRKKLDNLFVWTPPEKTRVLNCYWSISEWIRTESTYPVKKIKHSSWCGVKYKLQCHLTTKYYWTQASSDDMVKISLLRLSNTQPPLFQFRASNILYQLKDKLSEMPGLIHFLWHFFEKKNTFISHFVLFWSDCSPRTQ